MPPRKAVPEKLLPPREERPKRSRARRLVRLEGIAASAYEHPADAAALAALKKVPGFDLVLRKLFGLVGDRSLRLAFLASSVRVTPHQFPKLHALYRATAEVLDIRPLPELFVAQTPLVNAGTIGLAQPFIVVKSGMLELLTEKEMAFILGHELGHVLSGHVLYKTMLRILLRLSSAMVSVPLGGAALAAISFALLEWDRKSELSADRAGLLAVQDLDLAMQVQMKLAGGGRTSEMSVVEFLEQTREYEEGGTMLDSLMKLIQLTGQTHPFPVIRLAELKKWAESGAYEEILSGHYPHRTDEAETLVEQLTRTAESYKDSVESSQDPLARFVRETIRDLKRRARPNDKE
ncbi:MAG: M48 family metallopeptidase [Acidobacteria bacterium]|nr:M48 family metallopeptidase [Acidobacteriota bacterium]